ncbi:hypothetical protein PAXINDRAFT_16449 [Paxillus involutus ATCC 200175]|uniref:Protein kinase domain-containing protein n=1 Tax=Paxillus involutus ATCC 200175 TaxID=664439 RepID=A0A0C9TTK2_PAXIN|nr:hypothetical protein PAXINDRAFT_16449 [Paxillus involutus ATCC 200175]
MDRDEPPLDLTGNIRRLEEHPCAGGSYGDIYKCLYDHTSGTIEVAVKALRLSLMPNQGEQSSSERLPDPFRRELGIWRRLDHPNIVPFLGTTSGFGPCTSMVAVWMPNGTLYAFLGKDGDRLSITDRFGLLQDIATGLEYLHSRSVIHGDLSPYNVLIDETNRARLADFGSSSIIGDLPEALTYLQWSTPCAGTVRWAAPEQLQLADGEMFKIVGDLGFLAATPMLTITPPCPALRECEVRDLGVLAATPMLTITPLGPALREECIVRDPGLTTATPILTITPLRPALREECEVRDLGFLAAAPMLTITLPCVPPSARSAWPMLLNCGTHALTMTPP